MPEANSLEQHKVIAFGRNLDLVAQQRKNRTIANVMADMNFSEPGDRFTDELMGEAEPSEMISDAQETPLGTVDKKRRIAFFKTFHDGRRITNREKAEQLVDPTNSVVMAMAAGRERLRDKQVITRGLFEPAWEINEESGEPAQVAFPAARQIAYNSQKFYKGLADGETGPGSPVTVLNPDKLRQAKVLLNKSNFHEMDGGQPIIFVEEEDLQALVTSAEIYDRHNVTVNMAALRSVENGDTDSALGFKFVKVASGLLPKASSSTRFWVPVYYRSALMYKERPLVGGPGNVRISERNDRSYAWQAYWQSQHGVLRREDAAVCHIEVTRA